MKGCLVHPLCWSCFHPADQLTCELWVKRHENTIPTSSNFGKRAILCVKIFHYWSPMDAIGQKLERHNDTSPIIKSKIKSYDLLQESAWRKTFDAIIRDFFLAFTLSLFRRHGNVGDMRVYEEQTESLSLSFLASVCSLRYVVVIDQMCLIGAPATFSAGSSCSPPK